MGADQGVTAVVREAVGDLAGAVADARAAADGEQLDFLPPLRPTLGKDQRDRAETAVRTHRAGRPKGATNKATREMREFVRGALGYDPLLEMARWARHTPESLAIELGCTRLEAYDRLVGLHRELRKVFYADAAPTGEDGQPVPQLVMQVGGVVVGTAGSPPPWVYQGGPEVPDWVAHQAAPAVAAPAEPIEQNQSLSSAATDVSHGAGSHGDVK